MYVWQVLIFGVFNTLALHLSRSITKSPGFESKNGETDNPLPTAGQFHPPIMLANLASII